MIVQRSPQMRVFFVLYYLQNSLFRPKAPISLNWFFIKHFPEVKDMLKRFAHAIALLCIVHTVYASDDTVIGRYMSVTNKPTQAQTDLLSQIMQIRFPQNIQ